MPRITPIPLTFDRIKGTSSTLPQNDYAQYAITMDSFANGGNLYWTPIQRACSTNSTTNAADVTTTSSRDIVSVSHTSRTGKVLVLANMMLKTSRYTSSMNVYAGSTHLGNRRTNITTPTRMEQHNVTSAPVGSAVTYKVVMTSQDTGTTATFPGYTTSEITVMDL